MYLVAGERGRRFPRIHNGRRARARFLLIRPGAAARAVRGHFILCISTVIQSCCGRYAAFLGACPWLVLADMA